MYSQQNLYAILDAIGASAEVGMNQIIITHTLQINTGELKFSMPVVNMLEQSIRETEDSMYVILKAHMLGMIFKATRGVISTITMLNGNNKELKEYIRRDDFPALLNYLDENKNSDMVVEVIKLC